MAARADCASVGDVFIWRLMSLLAWLRCLRAMRLAF
jgi:hypothetical protein